MERKCKPTCALLKWINWHLRAFCDLQQSFQKWMHLARMQQKFIYWVNSLIILHLKCFCCSVLSIYIRNYSFHICAPHCQCGTKVYDHAKRQFVCLFWCWQRRMSTSCQQRNKISISLPDQLQQQQISASIFSLFQM